VTGRRRDVVRGALAAAGLGLLGGCGGVRLPWQAGPVPIVGILTPALDPSRVRQVEAFKQGMRELGYVEGQNVAYESRDAAGDLGRLQPLAAELVVRGVAVIVATSTPEGQAARAATQTVPIVVMQSTDLVAVGLAASLSHPGGNVTGLTNLARQTVAKALELLRQIVPDIARLGIMLNPTNDGKVLELAEIRTAAAALRVDVQPFEVRSDAEVEAALGPIARAGLHALWVLTENVTNGQVPRIAAFARAERLPAISVTRLLPASGGLMAYGGNVDAQWRRGAAYVDKILRGAKPADLPVEQPTVFDFIVNTTTADLFGLTIPPTILQQATEVIR
jgi:putative ABC transport system substrate-binding protein